MIRPYGGGPGAAAQQRGASEPRHHALSGPGRAVDLLGGSLFGGQDPFRDFGGFGADPFGGTIMRRCEDMTRGMEHHFGGQGGLAAGSLGRGGGGQYSCQTFAMSSVMGPDGKVHTERYSSSDVGNREHGIREAQHAYSNSSTGIDKMGMERQLGDRARNMVKERDRNTMEERSTEMFRGMDESGRDSFDRDFHGKAHHMPQHSRFGRGMLQGRAPGMLAGGRSPQGNSRQQQAAVEDGFGGGGHFAGRHRSVPSGRRP